MSYKVFIDGQEGTTGLKIVERFKDRSDIELIRIDEDKRKDPEERKKLITAPIIHSSACPMRRLLRLFRLLKMTMLR